MIPFDVDSIVLFISRFDKTGNQTLKYSEYCEAFLQRDENKLREIAKRVPRNVHSQISY
jgi:hypothetical protein